MTIGDNIQKDDQKVIEFDIRGQICPSTLLITLKEVNSHKEAIKKGGVRLTFKTDNSDSTVTIPDAVMHMGYGVNVTKEGDYYLIAIDDGK